MGLRQYERIQAVGAFLGRKQGVYQALEIAVLGSLLPVLCVHEPPLGRAGLACGDRSAGSGWVMVLAAGEVSARL